MGTRELDGIVVIPETFSALGLEESATSISSGTPPRVLSVLASILERSIQKNEKLLRASKIEDVVTLFHGSKAPTLTLRQYIERIFKYSRCSTSCFVVAYIYIERFIQCTGIRLTSLNIHRILITSVMIAAKFMDSECYSNAYFAKVGGVSTVEMNKLEMNFLLSLDFKLHITTEFFGKYCQKLDKEVIGGEFHILRLGEGWESKVNNKRTPNN